MSEETLENRTGLSLIQEDDALMSTTKGGGIGAVTGGLGLMLLYSLNICNGNNRYRWLSWNLPGTDIGCDRLHNGETLWTIAYGAVGLVVGAAVGFGIGKLVASRFITNKRDRAFLEHQETLQERLAGYDSLDQLTKSFEFKGLPHDRYREAVLLDVLMDDLDSGNLSRYNAIETLISSDHKKIAANLRKEFVKKLGLESLHENIEYLLDEERLVGVQLYTQRGREGIDEADQFVKEHISDKGVKVKAMRIIVGQCIISGWMELAEQYVNDDIDRSPDGPTQLLAETYERKGNNEKAAEFYRLTSDFEGLARVDPQFVRNRALNNYLGADKSFN